MSTALAVGVAAVFVWLGMVVAISFLEAPLKFRAPGVTVPIGLGIGRLVFAGLNLAEALLATTLIVVALVADWPPPGLMPLTVAIGALVVQLAAVRPALARRSKAVLRGEDAPRSRGHHVYIALEVVKVLALVAGGTLLLMG